LKWCNRFFIKRAKERNGSMRSGSGMFVCWTGYRSGVRHFKLQRPGPLISTAWKCSLVRPWWLSTQPKYRGEVSVLGRQGLTLMSSIPLAGAPTSLCLHHGFSN
jgi:hypothetical protein